MKQESIGTKYAILTKRVKVQYEKKPVLNLKCMQSVVFDKISTKWIEIFVP